jgi:RNA polymerase-binding transcription factor DksA
MANTKKAKKETKIRRDQKDLEKQTALLAEAGEIITSGISPGTENFPDLGDQATAETDQNFILRLKERDRNS